MSFATLFFTSTPGVGVDAAVGVQVKVNGVAVAVAESFSMQLFPSWVLGYVDSLLTVQAAEAPLTKLLWVQLALQNLSTTDTVAIETQAAAAVGVQAVVLSFEGIPAPACFGTGTLVLCEDWQRRAVQDLRSPVRVVAACPCGGPDAVVEVEVFCRSLLTVSDVVAHVAPLVWVTKDHALSFGPS